MLLRAFFRAAEPAPAPAPLVAPLPTTHRVISYTYPSALLRTDDSLYRLTEAEYSTGEYYGYAYDAVGNRQSLTSHEDVVNYQYDAANRLTSVNGQAYTWDDNGNLLSDGTHTYAYDHANRLVQVVSGTLTTEFAYNGAGDRVARTVDGVTTDYVLDPAAGLTQVLQETTASQATSYLYSHDLLAQYDSGTWAYHVNDGLGSVRQLADPMGGVVQGYSFDPFGVPLGESGGEPYGYTGEQEDDSTGLVYLRARYYDPAVGRFLTRDPWPGVAQRPMSLQPYVYASDNPVKYIDPMGLYNCLTGKQWAPELIGLCLLFDTSPAARNLLYQNGIVPVLSVVGWQDARIMFEHWLGSEGETMEFGSRLIRLIERDTAPLIEESRTRYLSDAARLMRGKAGRLPSRSYTSFLSNAEEIPTSFLADYDPPAPYQISEEVYIALGGVKFKRAYGGTVEEENQGSYSILLQTDFSINKKWTFAPNTEMGITENPPAEFNIADRIGIPRWLPRPVLVHSPVWALLEQLLGTNILAAPGNPWSVYIPDEWGHALEKEGYATPFLATGCWARFEELLAVDSNCDGWDLGDIVEGPKITQELLPTNVDPTQQKP